MEYVNLQEIQFASLMEMLPRLPEHGQQCINIPPDVFRKKLREGLFGEVYDCVGSTRTRCNKVIKIVNLKHSSAKMFALEVWISIKAEKAGIGPIVYGAFTCNNHGFLIIQKLHQTLRSYMQSDSYSNGEKAQKIVDGFELINVMHKNKIQHNDLHWQNVMLDKNLRLYIIDYGRAFIGDRRRATIESLNAMWDTLFHYSDAENFVAESKLDDSALQAVKKHLQLFMSTYDALRPDAISDKSEIVFDEHVFPLAIPPLTHELVGGDVKYWMLEPFPDKVAVCLSNLEFTLVTTDPHHSPLNDASLTAQSALVLNAHLSNGQLVQARKKFKKYLPMLNWHTE